MYDVLWAPTPYAARLNRLQFRSGLDARLYKLTPESKYIYGALVKRHNRLYVGFERLARRNPRLGLRWPGTSNMKRGPRDWLKSVGLLEAVESYV